jgi:hypothetical protein
MSYQRTGAWNIVKRLQYVEETVFGTTPTASPAFIHAGKIKRFSFNIDAQVNRYRSLGLRTVCKFLETSQMYSFELEYQPINSTLMKYGINNPGGIGTIDKSLSFVFSKMIDGVENYYFLKGCKTDSISVEVTKEAVSVTQSFLCKEVTTPVTTALGGLTTPVFATNPTTAPWTGQDGGLNPFLYNAVAHDTPRFSFEVSWNLDPGQPNGTFLISFLDPTNKDVNVDFDVWQKDTEFIADLKSGVLRPMIYNLKGPAVSVATFTDFINETYSLEEDAESNETTVEPASGAAVDVTIT